MVSSPSSSEEDEDISASGPGSSRGRPRYAVGDEVEVRLDEPGFRGAHFEATVAARDPGSGRYKVVFDTLLARRGGPLLQEDVAATHARPRPLRVRMFKRFDLVEAYHSEGWWPGVVSTIVRGKKPRYRYVVTFPLFREEVELPASLVRRRREFVCGTWIDAQEVLRGIPLYSEGSSVEVMCDEEKNGKAWMPATIIKMVGGTNYVVRYDNCERSTEVLHSCFIRPQPVFDKIEFEYELEPSTEVEVYQDGIWTRVHL